VIEKVVFDRHGLYAFDFAPVENDTKAFVANPVRVPDSQHQIQMINAFGLYSVIVVIVRDE
jgi:hypothetical protein